MNFRETILARWRYDHVPSLAEIKFVLERVLDIQDVIRAEHTKVGANDRLTSLGRQDAMRAFIADKAAAELYRSRKTVETLRSRLEAWRERLAPPPLDKADAAGATMRVEIRNALRAMSPGARMNALMAEDADLFLLEAVLQAPDFLSGLDAKNRPEVAARYVERKHPDDVAAIEQADEAITVLAVATAVATNTARAAADFPDESSMTAFVDNAVKDKASAIIGGVNQQVGKFGLPS